MNRIYRTIKSSHRFYATATNFIYNTALVRDIDESLVTAALTHDTRERDKVDYEKAVSQHEQFVHILSSIGLRIQNLPSNGFADSVFIEDTAVIIDNTAVITNPGADTRKGEVIGVEAFLRDNYSSSLRIHSLEELKKQAKSYIPLIEQHGQAVTGSLDGGDVLFTGRDIFVGLSERSDMMGMFALQVAFPQYPVHGVNMKGLLNDAFSIAKQLKKKPSEQSIVSSIVPETALHLKSFCSMLGSDTILVGGIMGLAFQHYLRQNFLYDRSYHTLYLPDMAAANCVTANNHIIRRTGSEFPLSESIWQKLDRSYGKQIEVNCSELSKVDGAITCCSVLFNS